MSKVSPVNLFVVFLLLGLLMLATAPAYADEDEHENNEAEHEEKENEAAKSAGLGGGIASMILYATIAGVVAVIGYIVWQVLRRRTKSG